MSTLQLLIGSAYLAAAALNAVMVSRPGVARTAQWLLGITVFTHAVLVIVRGQTTGQLPLVSRYEDLTVDALAIGVVFLGFTWWRGPAPRMGRVALPVAAIITLAALAHSRDVYPMSPALRTPWLLVHAQLNSLAVAFATLTAARVLTLRGTGADALTGRLLAWTLFLWTAMVAVGAYWAHLAWGRFWGWDPIESWALATLLAYAVAVHLGGGSAVTVRQARWSLVAYGLMLFTTYGLLLVRGSIHGQYLFL